VAFSLDVPPGDAPISEVGATPYRDFVIDLGVGNRVFSQLTVSGNEVFVVTDSEDANDLATWGAAGDTGMLRRYSLSTGAQKGAVVTLSGGASAVDVNEGVAFAGSGTGAQKVDVSGDFDASGVSTELSPEPKLGRTLWLTLD
jgi:hypothetical protein